MIRSWSSWPWWGQVACIAGLTLVLIVFAFLLLALGVIFLGYFVLSTV